MERAHAKDLQALRVSLESWIGIKEYLNQYDFSFVESETSERTLLKLS